MVLYSFGKSKPNVDPTAYIHPQATVIGNTTIGPGCFVGPGAVIRGDYGTIIIGEGTAVEDNVVIHARPKEECIIGNDVILGHGCVVHNAVVKDNAVIGMGSVVSDYAVIGEWAVVAEGAVVKKAQKVPSEALAYGVPASIKEDHVGEEYRKKWTGYKKIYRKLCKLYKSGLKEYNPEM